jgi:hypothetical protein
MLASAELMEDNGIPRGLATGGYATLETASTDGRVIATVDRSAEYNIERAMHGYDTRTATIRLMVNS